MARDDPHRNVQVRMSSLGAVGTDPTMALGATKYRGKAGRYVGGKRFYRVGEMLEESAPSLSIVNHVMGGELWNNLAQTVM
ncbi:MAG: hypothetical protein ACU84Q_19125 [Gammaproteobacteria bacterium]